MSPNEIRNLVDLLSILPEDERIMVDVLRQIISETLLKYCREKISFNGTNKQVFYKIYTTPEEIDEKPIKKLLREAIKLDTTFKKSE